MLSLKIQGKTYAASQLLDRRFDKEEQTWSISSRFTGSNQTAESLWRADLKPREHGFLKRKQQREVEETLRLEPMKKKGSLPYCPQEAWKCAFWGETQIILE